MRTGETEFVPAEQSAAPAPAVQLEGIEFGYGKTDPVLESISAKLAQGSWVSLVGANGSGKSTLAKLIGGLLTPKQGTIYIEGEELNRASAQRLRKKIGMVFQNPDNQFIGTTVEEDIAFGLEGQCLDRSEMKERISEYAEKLRIADLLAKHPAELSGGQKQRVALASVLAMQPRIVIFDEASSMLDEKARHELLALLVELHRSGAYTFISITHDADEVLQSDRVLVLDQGRIREDLRPEELFANQELLASCRLVAPFRAQLKAALASRGMELPVDLKDGSLEAVLCPLFSIK